MTLVGVEMGHHAMHVYGDYHSWTHASHQENFFW